MSWQHLQDSEPRARRQYRCVLCGLRIRKGAKHVKRVGVDGREFLVNRMHAVCESKTKDWDEGSWECHDEGDFRHWELGIRSQQEQAKESPDS